MPRPNSRNQAARRSARSSHKSNRSSGSSKGLVIGAIVIAALIIGGVVAWVCWPKASFSRSSLDAYVNADAARYGHKLKPGVAVYVDFSNGMQYGYTTPQAQAALRAVVNKLTDGGTEFYELAEGEIEPMKGPGTEIYNEIMDKDNYERQKAPIQNTLEKIVKKDQPALLITDFEEYNGNVIQQQNYAKDFFIDWLAKGNNIRFYKLDFDEKGKAKHLYFAVFDTNDGELDKMVAQAMKQSVPGIEQFNLGGPEFYFPRMISTLSARQGNNYHNGAGSDVVSAVREDGGSEAFICYAKTIATPDAATSQSVYRPLDEVAGPPALYFPMQVEWPDILTNMKGYQETPKKEDLFTHFFSHFFVNFNTQDGFKVDGIEARVFNMTDAVAEFDPSKEEAEEHADKKVKKAAVEQEGVFDDSQFPQVHDFFTASMQPVNYKDLPGTGWQEIFVDFDQKFIANKGKFPGNTPLPTDLFRIDVKISKAVPRLDRIDSFFGWPGNSSLAESVRNTLTAPGISPQGQTIVSYYIKLIK